jgi:hypothetical protein
MHACGAWIKERERKLDAGQLSGMEAAREVAGLYWAVEVAAVVVKPAAATSEVQRPITADLTSWQQRQPTDRRTLRRSSFLSNPDKLV